MLHRLPLIRHLWFRPRLFFCLAFSGLLGGLLAWLWPGHHVGSILIAYNAGVMLYVGLAVHMMFTSSKQHMRSRARVQDDGQIAVLLSVVIASIISLLAIAAQLSIAKDLIGISKYGHIALAGLTVITSWSFTQMMFALHYAHAYYQPEDGAHAGGLDFPGTKEPEYPDFLYVACVIGTSGQTADVAFTTSDMRRVGLLHCVLAFFYNATMIALTINISANLI